jgi:type I restriction enzyme S subunit
MSSDPSGWERRSWDEIVTLHYGKALRDPKPGPVVVYGTNGPTGKTCTQTLSEGPTIVVGRKGAYRGVVWAPAAFWVIDTAFFTTPGDGIDLLWAYYALLAKDINGLESGSAIPSTRREDFYAMESVVPPFDEQRRIAGVLRALDAKIEASEALASRIQSTTEAEVQRLAAEAVDRVPLAELVAELRRGISPKYTAELPATLVLNQKCVRGGRVMFDQARLHDHDLKSIDGREVAIGDLLINSTGFGTLGRTAVVRWLPEEAVVDSHITIVRADQSAVTADYLVHSLGVREREIEALGEGSTGQTELSRKRLGELPVPMPTREVQDAFAELVRPADRMIAALEQQVDRLRATRDALLPMLVSGKIRVAEDYSPGSEAVIAVEV